MFDGKEFCVINGPPGLQKAAIETKIIEVSIYPHGSSIAHDYWYFSMEVKWYKIQGKKPTWFWHTNWLSGPTTLSGIL